MGNMYVYDPLDNNLLRNYSIQIAVVMWCNNNMLVISIHYVQVDELMERKYMEQKRKTIINFIFKADMF